MKAGTVELRIERIVAGGFGLARGEDGVVLVRGGLPGELVTARPSLVRGALHAHAIDILEPHPSRVALSLPPGADLPLAYDAQLPIKEDLVREALERVGKIAVDLAPIHPSPRDLGYRTAAQYAVSDGRLGARAAGSDRVIPLAEDPLAAEPVAHAFARCAARPLHGIDEIAFRGSLHEGRALVGVVAERGRTAERLADALERSVAGVIWAEPDARGRFRGRTRVLTGSERLLEDFGGVLATVTVSSFAQVNPLAAADLYREAARIAGEGARAVELYAGSGVLGLHLAPRYAEVAAVDIAADAIKRGEADARRAKANVLFHRGDARTVMRHLPADLVAVDPPRAGLDAEVTAALAEHGPGRILYISCDPTTWARDVGRLSQAGYRVSFARPYDFYPYTHHVEVLSVLER